MNKAKTLVIKSNKLIGMQTQLSLVQMKIFALLIAKTLENPSTEYYRFSTKELMISCNLGDNNYTALQKITANMIKPVIFKWNEAEKQTQYPLLDGVIYDKWIVDIALHRLVKPFILDVATKYTKYYFENISCLNSTYSIRLYELLKEFEFRGARDFDMDNFRFLLNIKEGMYNRPYDIKTKIIEKAQQEISQKTDISFSYKEKKEGRKLVWISFKILSQHKQESKALKTVSKTSQTVWANSLETVLATKIFLSPIQIKTVLRQFDTEYLQRNITYTLKQKNIKNIAGYFMKALEQDFWQSLVLKEEQKSKAQKLAQAKQKEEELQKQQNIKAEQEKKVKIQEFIDSREEEVKKLIPQFITSNSFLLQNLGFNLDNQDELLAIIKWEKEDFNHLKSLFMGYIAKEVIELSK